MPAERPLSQVIELFERFDDLLGVMVVRRASLLGVITRTAIHRELTRRFFREIYESRPVERMLEDFCEPPLELPGTTPVSQAAAKAISRGGAFAWEPIVIRLEDGNLRLLDIRVLLIRQSELMEAALNEASMQRDAADHAARAKSDFLANMSHEIRTPMTAILGYAELLSDPQTPEADRDTFVQTIKRNGDHLLTILNDILDLSKIEAGSMRVEQVPCSIRQIVEDVTALMNARAQGKGIDLETYLATPIPEQLRTDPVRVRQILMNLVGNAIKFTESGSVTIRVEWNPSSVDLPSQLAIVVQDTGIGMTSDQVDRLFQPFAQADTSTQRRFGGTGLGLAISKRFAEMMNGNIVVESKAGLGSSFTLRIPSEACEVATSASAKPAADRPRGTTKLQGTRVLLAEDGPDNQRLISHVLRRQGIHVEVAANGRAAVDDAMSRVETESAFDLVLMDMQMPELDGYGATRELRERGFDRPIIAITAHAMAGDRQRCIAAGCDDYATKPLNKKRLLAAIEEQLSRREREPE